MSRLMPNDYFSFMVLTAVGAPLYAITLSDLIPSIYFLFALLLVVEKLPKSIRSAVALYRMAASFLSKRRDK